jgi:hypothetical protein
LTLAGIILAEEPTMPEHEPDTTPEHEPDKTPKHEPEREQAKEKL